MLSVTAEICSFDYLRPRVPTDSMQIASSTFDARRVYRNKANKERLTLMQQLRRQEHAKSCVTFRKRNGCERVFAWSLGRLAPVLHGTAARAFFAEPQFVNLSPDHQTCMRWRTDPVAGWKNRTLLGNASAASDLLSTAPVAVERGRLVDFVCSCCLLVRHFACRMRPAHRPGS